MLQKPTPLVTANTGNLLRCFVRRDPGGDKAVAKFQLFLGQEHNQPESCKFLMAALLNSRYACPKTCCAARACMESSLETTCL